MEQPSGRIGLFLLILVVGAFCLNWVWEMLQMPVYAEMAGRPWAETARRCTVATFGDVFMTFAVCGTISLAAGSLRWITPIRWNSLIASALLAAQWAVAVEWWAIATERWTYNDLMPVVPALGVGLWPLLQLSLLTPLAIWIASRLSCRMKPDNERRPQSGEELD